MCRRGPPFSDMFAKKGLSCLRSGSVRCQHLSWRYRSVNLCLSATHAYCRSGHKMTLTLLPTDVCVFSIPPVSSAKIHGGAFTPFLILVPSSPLTVHSDLSRHSYPVPSSSCPSNRVLGRGAFRSQTPRPKSAKSESSSWTIFHARAHWQIGGSLVSSAWPTASPQQTPKKHVSFHSRPST